MLDRIENRAFPCQASEPAPAGARGDMRERGGRTQNLATHCLGTVGRAAVQQTVRL